MYIITKEHGDLINRRRSPHEALATLITYTHRERERERRSI